MTTNITESQVTKHSSDDAVVLSVQGVSKKFCRSLKRSLFYGLQDIASELVGARTDNSQLRKDEFWALKDINFELKKGESLGLVGANGSGKTTLLRIISGLIRPDTGSVKITGRVAPLIALGAGFNPILTGRENIYVNMSILGLSKAEIDDRFDEVLDFAEIGDAIDAPVQTYSSGMAARLGFACAIHTEPDILLIDEVLAVGDIKFRAKCYRRLAKLAKKDVSFVLVSHNSHSILSICSSAIYLSQGNMLLKGDTESVMNRYESNLFLNAVEKYSGFLSFPENNKADSLGLDITYLCFRNQVGNIIKSPQTGESVYFCVGCKASKNFDDISLAVLIKEISGEEEIVLNFSAYMDNCNLQVTVGDNEIQLYMPCLGLKAGAYNMKLHIAQTSLLLFDALESFRFIVSFDKSMNTCLYYQQRFWKSINNIKNIPKFDNNRK